MQLPEASPLHSDSATAGNFAALCIVHQLCRIIQIAPESAEGEVYFLTLGAQSRSLKNASTTKNILMEYHLQFTAWLHIRRLPLAWPGRKLPT